MTKEWIGVEINNKRVFLASAVCIAICVLAILAYCSRVGKSMLGIPTIVVVNDSGTELTDVCIVLSTAESTMITRTYPRIHKGASESVASKTSDLQVDRIDYFLNGIKRSYTGGGLACPGEELVLSIGSNGKVTTRHEL